MTNYVVSYGSSDILLSDYGDYIALTKPGQPSMRVYKHKVESLGPNGWVTVQKNKARNLIKEVRKLIKEAIKDGKGKAM